VHADSAWFVQARFGLFVHWGLYALPARHFDPDLYDPASWAEDAWRIDWHHPDFPVDVFHPRRDDPAARARSAATPAP
jgi:alpha-L-fucosidase